MPVAQGLISMPRQAGHSFVFSLNASMKTTFVRRFALRATPAVAALTALILSLPVAAQAQAPKVSLSCAGRVVPGALADGKLNADALIEAAMRGKTFVYGENAAVVATEAMLVQYYGMRQSLRSLPSEPDRKAVGRIAHLIQNNSVVAAQMALGSYVVAHPAGDVPRPLYTYVNNATEPYHGDDELNRLAEQIKLATTMTEEMSPKPKAFARWVIRAAAFEDAVAHDAAMAGFCMSSPTLNDHNLMKSAYGVAKLDRSRKYRDPAVHSGGMPDLNPLHKK